MKKFMRFMACAALMFTFAACSDSNDTPDPDPTPQPTQLAKPDLAIGTKDATSFIVNWKAVPNATGYIYTVDSEAEQPTTALQVVRQGLTPETAYTVKVKATASGYTDSEWATLTVTTDAQSTASEVVTGNYAISAEVGENQYEDLIFEVTKDGSDYKVNYLFGYPVPLSATFDASKGELMLDGMGEVTFSDGPQVVQFFGKFYYTSQDGSTAFSLYSIKDLADETADGTDPCIIKVDPATGELVELSTNLLDIAGKLEGNQVTAILGVSMRSVAGTAIEKTDAPLPTALSASQPRLKAAPLTLGFSSTIRMTEICK